MFTLTLTEGGGRERAISLTNALALSENKKPLPVSRKGLVFPVQLELINDVKREQEVVPAVRCIATRRNNAIRYT